MGNFSLKIAAEPIRSVTSATIIAAGAAYTGIGTNFENPCRIFHLVNDTDAALMFSLNGLTDHFMLPANGFLLLDVTMNKILPEGFFFETGQRIYVKEINSPTTGSVYLTNFYGIGGDA